VLASHGADPRTLALIAYGGNGAVHAWAIANELGVGRVLIPKAAPAFSALGVLVADSLVDLVHSYVTPLAQVDLPRLRNLMSEVTDEARKELEPTGLGAAAMEHFVQMCYRARTSTPSPRQPTWPRTTSSDWPSASTPSTNAKRLLLPQPASADPGVRLVAPGCRRRSRSGSPALRDGHRRRQARIGARAAVLRRQVVDTRLRRPAAGPTAWRSPVRPDRSRSGDRGPAERAARLDPTGNYEGSTSDAQEEAA
jgi:hypothetical protein